MSSDTYIRFTNHILERMKLRDISRDDIKEAVDYGFEEPHPIRHEIDLRVYTLDTLIVVLNIINRNAVTCFRKGEWP